MLINITRSIFNINIHLTITKKGKLNFPTSIEKDFVNIYKRCQQFTMTPWERMYALYQSTKFVSLNKIPGDFVECGVWRGGSAMTSALTFLKMKDKKRRFYLYDTYEGMSKPTQKDKLGKELAIKKWQKLQKENYNQWCYAPLKEVKKNLFSTKYPKNRLMFIKGKVENTIPESAPKKIAILRLDTDWYESTYHELYFLFPLISQNGILLIDDYGRWQGAKEATDKYFKEKKLNPLFNRIDKTAVLTLKTKS